MFVEETAATKSFGVFGLVDEAVHKLAHHAHALLLVLGPENEGSRRAIGAKHVAAQRAHNGLVQAAEGFGTEIAVLAEDALVGLSMSFASMDSREMHNSTYCYSLMRYGHALPSDAE